MQGVVGDVFERKEKPPVVRFERVPVEDREESIKQGKYVAKDVDYALVTPPYSRDVFKQPVTEWFENLYRDMMAERLPKEWLDGFKKMYDAFKNGQELPVQGTPIKGWGIISPSMQENLIRDGITTVEMLADITDEGIRRVGMGAVELKHKATGWLKQLNDKGPLTQEIATVKGENHALKVQLETMQKQIQALMQGQKVEVAAVEITQVDSILDDEDLIAEYVAKFGEKPHHRMKAETIRAKLKE